MTPKEYQGPNALIEVGQLESEDEGITTGLVSGTLGASNLESEAFIYIICRADKTICSFACHAQIRVVPYQQ